MMQYGMTHRRISDKCVIFTRTYRANEFGLAGVPGNDVFHAITTAAGSTLDKRCVPAPIHTLRLITGYRGRGGLKPCG